MPARTEKDPRKHYSALDAVERFVDRSVIVNEYEQLDWEALSASFPPSLSGEGYMKPTITQFVQFAEKGALALHAKQHLAHKTSQLDTVRKMTPEEFTVQFEGRPVSQEDIIKGLEIRLRDEGQILDTVSRVGVPVTGSHREYRGVSGDVFASLESARAIFEASELHLTGNYIASRPPHYRTQSGVGSWFGRFLAPRERVGSPA